MDTRLTTTHGTWRLVLAANALALLVVLGATSASAARPTACRVRNTGTGETFTALQAAIEAAPPRVRLTVAGTCHGNTVIDRSLAIKGVLTPGSGRPILDGKKGHVLRVKPAARVTIRGLVVQGGSFPTRIVHRGVTFTTILGRGGGILNRGMLRLLGVVVRWDDAGQGGGVYNSGVLRLRGASRVRDNTSRPYGRGPSGVAGL